MKILFVIKAFHQGWGGAPESVRLMARKLAEKGISSDALTGRRLHSRIEELAWLPPKGSSTGKIDLGRLSNYQSILQVGPWQNPIQLSLLLRRMRPAQNLFYLPRGGLWEEEFAGARGLKKKPYFSLIERHFIARADGIVYSSEAERQGAARAATLGPAEHVIPDFFSPLSPFDKEVEAGGDEWLQADKERKLTFSFLAEIRPMKGLMHLVQAFVAWVQARQLEKQVRLLIAGGVRPGREPFLAQVKRFCAEEGREVDISFTGPLAHELRPQFYAATDVFVAPSQYESFGLTILEALNAGTPVIAGPKLGVLEQLPASSYVTAARSLQPEDLVGALERAFNTRETGEGARPAIRNWAKGVIDTNNATAHARWAELLQAA